MASLSCFLEKEHSILTDLFGMHRHCDDIRYKERDAAIKIQSWFRSLRVQNHIRYLHACAVIIQKTYRGYDGRLTYRKNVQNKMNMMRKIYYDAMATKIQARWRGHYIRKFKFDFYARKAYLNGLVTKNEMFRMELSKIKERNELEENLKKIDNQMAKDYYINRKTHYLLSTNVCRGVYNSPTEPLLQKEYSLRVAEPLSHEERTLIENVKQMNYLKTSTGIPRADETDDSFKKSCSLPPLRTTKPQGPFRSPVDVQKQRYKELQPTLRVATEFQSVEKARLELRQDEWTKRIIDKSFLPSTKRNYTYYPALHTSASYGRLDYGTKHFRDENREKRIHEKVVIYTQPYGQELVQSPHARITSNDVVIASLLQILNKYLLTEKPFQRVVSPIPVFEQLGKTY